MNWHAAGRALSAVCMIASAMDTAALGYLAVDFALPPLTRFLLTIIGVGLVTATSILPGLGSHRYKAPPG